MVTLSTLYSLLFAFSLVLINPEGFQRGDIWTQPKLLALNLITTCNSWVVLHQWWQGTLAIPFAWKLGLGLWVLFLTLGLQSTLLSPFPLHSLWGQSTLGDGWVYWALLAAFVLSNALVIKLVPRLLRLQLYGFLIGGALVALSIFPQVWDWRIDYTATSGQVSLSSPQMLESTVWQRQMPIGLYSNRGHVAFVLATAGVLSFLGWCWGWIRPLPAAVIGVLTSTALLYTRVRGGIWALLVAATYLLWRYGRNPIRQWVVWPCSIGLLWISCLFAVAAPFWELEQFSSGRLHLWHLSLKGIIQRPLWGWGFDGFGIAYPFIADWTGRHQGYLLEKVPVTKVVTLNDFTFSYQ